MQSQLGFLQGAFQIWEPRGISLTPCNQSNILPVQKQWARSQGKPVSTLAENWKSFSSPSPEGQTPQGSEATKSLLISWGGGANGIHKLGLWTRPPGSRAGRNSGRPYCALVTLLAGWRATGDDDGRPAIAIRGPGADRWKAPERRDRSNRCRPQGLRSLERARRRRMCPVRHPLRSGSRRNSR